MVVKAEYMTDDRPLGDLVVSTFDKNAAVFDPRPNLFNFFAKRLIELADIPAGARVLDVGTGKGNVLFEAMAKVGPTGHGTGVDFAPEMIRRLEEKAAERGMSNVSAAVMDSSKLGFPDATFDVAMAGSVICFVPDLDAQLAELKRVVKPGGKVAIWEVAEPTFDWFFALLWVYSQDIPPEEAARMHARSRGTPKLHSPDIYPDAFARAGFVDLVDVRTEHEFEFDDEAHYWRWLESTVAPWYYDWLDPEHMTKFKAMVSNTFKSFEREGKYFVPAGSRSFVARRP